VDRTTDLLVEEITQSKYRRTLAVAVMGGISAWEAKKHMAAKSPEDT
jgi:hypothetical protein